VEGWKCGACGEWVNAWGMGDRTRCTVDWRAPYVEFEAAAVLREQADRIDHIEQRGSQAISVGDGPELWVWGTAAAVMAVGDMKDRIDAATNLIREWLANCPPGSVPFDIEVIFDATVAALSGEADQ
jgi:hypothetical protein